MRFRGQERRGPENQYIGNMDHRARVERDPNLDAKAEKRVRTFFNDQFPGTIARFATEEEDAGDRGPGLRGIATDVIVYTSEKGHQIPAMAIQVTTATDHKVIMKKAMEMQNQPFVRLPEMKREQTALPRILIFLPREKLGDQGEANDLGSQRETSLQILYNTLNCLKYDLNKTALDSEREKITKLMLSVSSQIEFIKKGRQSQIQ